MKRRQQKCYPNDRKMCSADTRRTDGCRNRFDRPRFHVAQPGPRARHAEQTAGPADRPCVFSGGVQLRVPERAVHVPRRARPAQQGQRAGLRHQRGHLFCAQGVRRPAAPDLSAVERLQQAGHPRLRRVQRRHDWPEGDRQARGVRAGQGRRGPAPRGARRRAQRAGLREGLGRPSLAALADSRCADVVTYALARGGASARQCSTCRCLRSLRLPPERSCA